MIIGDSYGGMFSDTHPAPDGAGSPGVRPKDSALRWLTPLKMTNSPARERVFELTPPVIDGDGRRTKLRITNYE